MTIFDVLSRADSPVCARGAPGNHYERQSIQIGMTDPHDRASGAGADGGYAYPGLPRQISVRRGHYGRRPGLLRRKMMVDSGIILLKYWLEVSPEEQTRRLEDRIDDGREIWKLSPMDVASYDRWDEYTRARDEMFKASDTPWAPWFVAKSDDKWRALLARVHDELGLATVEIGLRASIPAGGVGQALGRLRRVPTTATLAVNVDTSANTLNTLLTVDANAHQLANISFSDDLKKVYLWRRTGGAAPATIMMDGPPLVVPRSLFGLTVDEVVDNAGSVYIPTKKSGFTPRP